MESNQLNNLDFGLFILFGLLIYRLSFLIAREEGPFSLFSRLRGRIDPSQSTWIGRGINCPLCISFWLSFIIAYPLSDKSIYNIIFLWLSFAGLSMLFERISN